jgi:hypothetical protein
VLSRLDVEEWAYRILSAIDAGAWSEDSLVELKSTWPGARDVARQLAGHSNSARGQTILWLFGVDQSKGVVPFVPADAAQWSGELAKEFDGVTPAFVHYNLEWNGQIFTALAFDTDAAPYVVFNPKRGQPNSGPFDREIPWREGMTRSAKRAEIVLITRPAARLPIVNLIGGRLTVTNNDTSPSHRWYADLKFYAASETLGRMFLPQHGVRGWLTTSTGDRLVLGDLKLWAPAHDDPHVTQTDTQVAIDGAGLFRFQGHIDTTTFPHDSEKQLSITVQVSVAGADRPVFIEHSMRRDPKKDQFKAAWIP